MTMSSLYPCGKPCSRGTHNETVKYFALFCSIMASNLHPVGVFLILESNGKFYHINNLTMVIQKSRNLIVTEEIAQFGPK